MGRVASYKRVKKFGKEHRGGEYVWGDSGNGKSTTNKKKQRSVTAQKHHQQKMKRKNFDGSRSSGGFDDIPSEDDDFDMSDFKVKKQKMKRLDHELVPQRTEIPTVRASASSSGTNGENGNDGQMGVAAKATAGAGVRPAAVVNNNTLKIGNTSVAVNIPVDEREERRSAKLLMMDPKTGKSLTKKNTRESKIEGRREGESMNAFNRRLKEETANALAENYKKSRSGSASGGDEVSTKAQRKREYAKLRKQKKKRKGRGKALDYNSDDAGEDRDGNGYSDGFVTGEDAAAARVSFLERAEQPPSFKQLPRGAQHKKLKMKIKGVGEDGGEGSSSKMGESKIKAEQNQMEIMRKRVQAQYALMKAKRRQQGASFHL